MLAGSHSSGFYSGPSPGSTPSASVPVLGAYSGRSAPVVVPTSRPAPVAHTPAAAPAKKPAASTGGSSSGFYSGSSKKGSALSESVPVLGAYTGRRAPVVVPTSRPARNTGGKSQGSTPAGFGEPFQPQFKGSAAAPAAAAPVAAAVATAPAKPLEMKKGGGSLKARIGKVLESGYSSGFYGGSSKASSPASAAPAPVAAAPAASTPAVAPVNTPAPSTDGGSSVYRSGPPKSASTESVAPAPVVPTPTVAMGTERGSGRVAGSPSSEGSSQDYLVSICMGHERMLPHSSSRR